MNKQSSSASSIAYGLSKSLWEYSLFLAGISAERKISLLFDIFVINPEGQLFHPIQKNDMQLTEFKCFLDKLETINFEDQIPSNQDPLCTALDLMEITADTVYIFLPSDGIYVDQVKSSINRRTSLNPSSPLPQFIIIGENTELCEFYSQISRITVFENCVDCYFQFFRNLYNNTLFPPNIEILKIGDYVVDCLMYQIINSPIIIETKTICKCHDRPTIPGKSLNCPILEKRVANSNISTSPCIGDFIVPIMPEIQSEITLEAIAKIPLDSLSEGYLFGYERCLVSQKQFFNHLVNDMKMNKYGLIVKRIGSKMLGDELLIMLADKFANIIHIKNIANRYQIIRFGDSIQESEDAQSANPIALDLVEVESLISFIMNY